MTELRLRNIPTYQLHAFVNKIESIGAVIKEFESAIGFEISQDMPIEVGLLQFRQRKALKRAGIPYVTVFRSDKAKEISEDLIELLPYIFKLISVYKTGMQIIRG